MAKWGEIKCPRCEEREAKLAKAVETLERIAMHDTQGWAITTLAELKGRDDDQV